MNKPNDNKLLAEQFQHDEALESKRKELLGNLASNEYAWNKELYHWNIQQFIEKLKAQGVHVRKIWLAMKLRGKILKTKIPFVGVWLGSTIITGEESKDSEATIVHEDIHIEQYRENALLKAWLWFIKFGILEQWKILKKLRNERKKYGKEAANRFAINNSPMEFEAYLHEGDTWYLETREPFAYKKFETKEWRSQAIQNLMTEDIVVRLDKIDELTQMIEHKKDISKEEINMINILIDELLEDTIKIKKIKEEYKDDDWELISTFQTPKWPMVRLESERSRDKRLAVLEKLLAKEHAYIQEIKKDKNIKIISSQDDMDEYGVIKIQAKDGDNERLLQMLLGNSVLQKLAPQIILNNDKSYIRISFTL